MTTDELKIKLNEIKLKYYEPCNDGFRIKSTDQLFLSKLSDELEQLKSHEDIWDISSTEPFKFKSNYIGWTRFKVVLLNSKTEALSYFFELEIII